MSDNREEISKAIQELEKEGIDLGNYHAQTVGLGDAIEKVLIKLGVTEERFKSWFNLKECNCSKRKAWLNKIFSWKKRELDEQ